MHNTTLIDAAGSVIRTDGPTRTQIDQNNCRETENLEKSQLLLTVIQLLQPPPLHSFGSACVIRFTRFHLVSRVRGSSFSSDSTYSEQISRSNNLFPTTPACKPSNNFHIKIELSVRIVQ